MSPTPEREFKSTVFSKALVYGITFLYLLFIGWYILLFAVYQENKANTILTGCVDHLCYACVPMRRTTNELTIPFLFLSLCVRVRQPCILHRD